MRICAVGHFNFAQKKTKLVLNRIIKRFFSGSENGRSSAGEPALIPRSEHPISRDAVSRNALKVLYRLRDSGFEAYLVGGCIRDIVLGYSPKDFDVATNASPEEIKSAFRNCRLIGRRFRLAHIVFGREIIEVATFRSGHTAASKGAAQTDDQGRILRDNVYGTIGDDVLRRDFTINALYYNIEDFSIVDFVDGMQDLEDGVIRLLGDPETRYREDAVRALRAVRFAAKLDFEIEEATAEPLDRVGEWLDEIPAARLFEEVLKLFQSGHAVRSMEELRRYDLLQNLFAGLDERLKDGDKFAEKLVGLALKNTDLRVSQDKPITPAFLYAVLLWPDVQQRAAEISIQENLPPVPSIHAAADEILADQVRQTAIPKRFSVPAREIWALQPRLEQYTGKRAMKNLEHPRFRAGYDLMVMRAQAGEPLQDRVDWWTEVQEQPGVAEQLAEVRQRSSEQARNTRRKRGGNRRRGPRRDQS